MILCIAGFSAIGETVFNGKVTAGKGGSGLIKGRDGAIIIAGKNISACLAERKIDINHARISIKNDMIYVEEKIPVSACK